MNLKGTDVETIDLRSDTVTKPSPEMREAMLNAEVGDDVYGEDPTAIRLQEKVADLLGKEAALFVPSGVMANQLALKIHTQPGDEVIVESDSHIFNYETAGAAFLSHVQLCTVKGNRGIFNAGQVASSIRSSVYYNPRTALVCLENTHNKAGGTIYPLDEIRGIHDLARSRNLALHLDGARLWNASVASGISPREYAQYFDTVSVCFSKGLGAPVGSAITGLRDKIELARKYRKIFGGGMRQIGILAAGAIYALDRNISRLRQDHEHAAWLAQELSKIPGIQIDVHSVQTNIIIFSLDSGPEKTEALLSNLKAHGVLISDMGHSLLRAVTHLDVSLEQVKTASAMIKSFLVH